MKTYSGIEIPDTIRTDERIFKILTFDGDTFLVNKDTAQMLLSKDEIKSLWHLWNFKWERYSKLHLKNM